MCSVCDARTEPNTSRWPCCIVACAWLRDLLCCAVLAVLCCAERQVVPGEGAHATFAPRGWRQMALTAYVTARIGHCEIEEVACGRGLELIYEFLLSDPTTK